MGRVIAREVFAGDFFKGEETMSFCAVIHERCFKTWFNAGDFAFVNIRFFLLMTRTFDIQIIQPLSIYEGNTQLFLLSCVNQHSFHLNLLVIFTLSTKLRAK
ncbi:hypothetical protein L085_19225 [Serratia sp. FS14]|nr:hypothetical protein L085_19225 [Serratia sp. FS14]EMF07501.1 hypothetical protein F518_01765 [Serratia marcescens VGH107]EMF07620.1 hypothetical protein F518_00249 [Serratia marcescens VGH107]ERH71192.1 hypothetical protein N040_21185 [Serratia marcescens EGD-HP20]OMP55762.1 hypothetical protein BES32_02575 [Serratia marcescens]